MGGEDLLGSDAVFEVALTFSCLCSGLDSCLSTFFFEILFALLVSLLTSSDFTFCGFFFFLDDSVANEPAETFELLFVMPLFTNVSVSSSAFELSVVVLDVSTSSLTAVWITILDFCPFFLFPFLVFRLSGDFLGRGDGCVTTSLRP